MMVQEDWIKMADELTELFIVREYADRVGISGMMFKDEAIRKYRNDPVFHNRVKSAVHGVLEIIKKFDA